MAKVNAPARLEWVQERSTMHDVRSLWRGAAAAVFALLPLTVGCSAGSADESARAGAEELSGSYRADFGFAFDPASTERLAALLRPGDTLNLVIDGESVPFNTVDWETVAATPRSSLSMQALRGGEARPLGDLALRSEEAAPACEDSPALESVGQTASAIANEAEADVSAAASCTHGSYSWYCINCQCRSGIRVLGYSRRYICIYGELYPENVYSCNCSFTSRICGIET
jgi:hypothetical protein